jgi:hypothetical protein
MMSPAEACSAVSAIAAADRPSQSLVSSDQMTSLSPCRASTARTASSVAPNGGRNQVIGGAPSAQRR